MSVDDPEYAVLDRYTRALAIALGFRDPYTRLHSDRVVAIARSMGTQVGLDGSALAMLVTAAAFHDVGKIGIPDSILLKPGRLDEDETAVMQRHSETGEKIILATAVDGAIEVARIIRHHHEHFDGGGYPDGLRGDEIPLASRIIAIADSYDAMALTRSYNRARSHPEIMRILAEETGTKHDPWLMDVFRSIVDSGLLETRAGAEPSV
jgi:HD-GYP domain-containing protein (c-di-GMP phosphodiesterase class II)